MTSATSNNKSLKYQRFTSFGWRYIGIRKLGFVAKTQFLCLFLIFVRRMKSRRGTRPQSPTGNVTYKLDLLLVPISLQWFNNMCFNKCFFDNNLIFMFNNKHGHNALLETQVWTKYKFHLSMGGGLSSSTLRPVLR